MLDVDFTMNKHLLTSVLTVLLSTSSDSSAADNSPATSWKIGTPIVAYWAGPPMTDATARQMS